MVCRFNHFGFCKVRQENCNFYHSKEMCDIYLEKGICYRVHCRKRNPVHVDMRWKETVIEEVNASSFTRMLQNKKKWSDAIVESSGNTSSKETKSISCRGCKMEKSIFTCEECGKEFGISCLIESHDIINMYMKNSIRYRCDMVHKNPCI